MRIEYHPAVEHELRAIQRYYDSRSPGLGAQFLDEFERQVLLLAASPERWMIVGPNEIRRCLMNRFPYIICFRNLGPERLRITVVKHQRRHPDFGFDRE